MLIVSKRTENSKPEKPLVTVGCKIEIIIKKYETIESIVICLDVNGYKIVMKPNFDDFFFVGWP